MLEMKHLTIETNTLLISDATFRLNKGTIYGLSAPNGSGKSTLMRTIANLRSEKQGQIRFVQDGRQVASEAELKKELFYFENTAWLDGNLTGLDYLNLINRLWKGDPQQVNQVIEFWQLTDYIKKPIKKYSLGMKQKVLLSLYQVSQTDYWFLDEPTIGLDRQSLALLERYLINGKKQGKMFFFASHAGEELFRVCDQLFSIDCRKLITLGGPGND